jgi:integrase
VLYGKTRKEVAQKLNEGLRRKQQGVPFASERLTVGAWLDHWLEHVVKAVREPTTYEGHEVMVRCHIKPLLGSVPLVKLQPEHVEAWLRDLHSSGRGLRTRQSALARLRTVLNLAVKRSHIIRNPAELVDMPRSVRRKVAAPTGDEVRRLLDAVKGDRLEAIITVALAPGLRRTEILGLRWEDIDLDRRTLTVRNRVNRVNRIGIIVRAGTKTEAGDERTIVLPQSIVQSLTAHRTRQLETKLVAGPRWHGPSYSNAVPTGYVFTSTTGTILDPRNLNRYFSRVRAKANLPTHTFHQLLTSFATTAPASSSHKGFRSGRQQDPRRQRHPDHRQHLRPPGNRAPI